MTMPELTLCAPDGQKTCFACCPPIRPSGYEHIRYKTIIQRVLRENTLCFRTQDREISPITGFSCWALGYLDKEYRRIGCLLHPASNNGVDLRYRVDYGEKCSRESCPESKVFASLDEDSKRFWLALADGLDAFSYSSRKHNPLFSILGWGSDLLGLIPPAEGYKAYKKEAFFDAYPFLEPRVSARAPVYLAKCLIKGENVHLLKNAAFGEEFERFSSSLSSKLGKAVGVNSLLTSLPGSPATEATEGREIAPPPPLASKGLGENVSDSACSKGSQRKHPVHRLPLDRDFLDYLRLFAGIKKLGLEEALLLKRLADEALARFRKSL